MTSGKRGSAPAIRLWWAAPLALVVLTAIVFVAVVLPALAGGTHVPSRLVVHRSPGPAATPSPTPSTTPSPVPTRTTTVVQPQQPVVRESDDSNERSGRRQGSGGHDD